MYFSDGKLPVPLCKEEQSGLYTEETSCMKYVLCKQFLADRHRWNYTALLAVIVMEGMTVVLKYWFGDNDLMQFQYLLQNFLIA
jgi:hypothetical protein